MGQGRALWIWRLAIALALAALLAGCGGSSGQATSAAPAPIPTVHGSSLSKAEFLKQADALCFKARERAQKEFALFLKSTKLVLSRANVLRHASEIFNRFNGPYYERQVADIRALGAPRGDEAKVTAILNAMQQAIAAARKEPAVYFYGGDPFGKAYGLATSYGLTHCATS